MTTRRSGVSSPALPIRRAVSFDTEKSHLPPGVVLLHRGAALSSEASDIDSTAVLSADGRRQGSVGVQLDESALGRIPMAALAQLVRLSRYYFCRSFKRSFGFLPRGYRIGLRIEARPEGSARASFGEGSRRDDRFRRDRDASWRPSRSRRMLAPAPDRKLSRFCGAGTGDFGGAREVEYDIAPFALGPSRDPHLDMRLCAGPVHRRWARPLAPRHDARHSRRRCRASRRRRRSPPRFDGARRAGVEPARLRVLARLSRRRQRRLSRHRRSAAGQSPAPIVRRRWDRHERDGLLRGERH